jgi:hypothetical protein
MMPYGNVKRFSSESHGSAQPTAVAALLHELTARKLLLHVHDKLLALACFGDIPALGEQADYPNGYVENFDPLHAASAMQAWERLKSDAFQLRPVLGPLVSA